MAKKKHKKRRALRPSVNVSATPVVAATTTSVNNDHDYVGQDLVTVGWVSAVLLIFQVCVWLLFKFTALDADIYNLITL